MKLKKKLTAPCLAIAAMALLSAPASAAVLDFDSVAAANGFPASTNLGGGFSMVTNNTHGAGIWSTGLPQAISSGPRSGPNYALNFNSRIGNISSSSAFTLNSLWAHADARAGSTSVRFQGLDALGGNVLHTLDAVLSVSWQQILFGNWTGVSVLTWDSVSPDVSNIGIDDVVYNATKPGPSPVPLPAAFPLLGGGLGLLGWLGARRRRSAASA